MMLKRFLVDLAMGVAAVGISVGLLMIGLWVAGYPAGTVVGDWVGGAVGSSLDVVTAIKNACPLIFTGLAAGVAFRAGVFNIGAEGQFILGGIAAAAVATRIWPGAESAWGAIPAALMAAVVLGAGWAMIAGALERWRGVPVVLSTILLNIIALQLLGALVEGPAGPLQEMARVNPQSDILAGAFWLPMVWAPLHVGIFVALGAAAVAWVVQSRTVLGFEIRVVGANATAARLAGMPVASRQLAVMAASGAFAGLGGAIQVMGIEGHFLGSSTPGYGYAGIAVALLGRLHPVGIVLAALLFGFLDQGAASVEISRFPLPHEAADIVKGVMVLVILVGAAWVGRRQMSARER